ncbi:RsmB/NOP family class I SAM-dependent RNA methyltransferase [Aestuariivita boseongensis]|uniref:RsmB/NOP family class I SAM-dependent RNA methyltransferase n=1 Tax=Aestuariivita boseongensis TaxID=1470562 RepID=UPI0006820BFD|nr:RsmB/NOP family class I SAM-dependent RNA methyltransferase [Aestuariivita boseongensis]
MTPAARVQAAIGLLDDILAGQPAEQALTGWARKARFAGSKDRAAVRDHVFDALRCRRSFAALGGSETGRGLMIGAARAQGADLEALFDGSGYGPAPVSAEEQGREPAAGADAGDIPDWLWPEFERSLGAHAQEGAAYLRNRAPVFLRANLRKTSRADLIARLQSDGITAIPHDHSPTALEVTQGARQLRNTPTFRDGLFELQDAASQAVTDALPLAMGMTVLDYCAGGGGKTLAMGARADLQLAAHDANPQRMRDLPDRAARAGIAVSILQQIEPNSRYDLILCDAPCSGSGSWRRAPDGKWILTPERLTALTQTQDQILRAASALVAPGGVLAYATCSVLSRENEDRVAAFLSDRPDWRQEASHRWPLAGGGDGFFLAILRRV